MKPDLDPTRKNSPRAGKISLSGQDKHELAELFSKIEKVGISSTTNIDDFVEWYLNIFGAVALELFIEECKKAIREKEYKKLLAILAKLENKRQNLATNTIDSNELVSATPVSFNDLDEEAIQSILEEYEIYFDEPSISELPIENTELSSQLDDESGYISFGEISDLVSKFETRIKELIDNEELTQEEADELIKELKDIEVGKFASISKNEIEEIKTSIQFSSKDELRTLKESLEIRENMEIETSSRLFGEEGFVSLDADSFENLRSKSTASFAELEELNAQFEAELVYLVEQGTITSDEAYELRDQFQQVPISQASMVRESTIEDVGQTDFRPVTAEESAKIFAQTNTQPAVTESESPISNAAAPIVSSTPVATSPVSTQVDNFVPVNFFAPGTRPLDVPVVAPASRTDATPNLVSTTVSFSKPDVQTFEEITQPPQVSPRAQPQEQQVQPIQQFRDTVQPEIPTQKEQPKQIDDRTLNREQPEANDPKPQEYDYDKLPERDKTGCVMCNKSHCDGCAIKMESDHLENALQELRSSSIAPSISPPIVPNSFGSDFQADPIARSIDSRSLTNSGMVR